MSSSIEFPESRDLGPRDWGKETLLLLVPGKYTLKRIEMKAGSCGGLQYHRLKDEGGVLLKGEMIVRYDPGDGTIVERLVIEGEAFHFPPGAVHQAEAWTDCMYIEASTPHFNDRVHVEHKYGLPKEKGGLPSTDIGEIEAR